MKNYGQKWIKLAPWYCIPRWISSVCVLVLPTDRGAGDDLDLVQSLRQTLLNLCVLQWKQIPRSWQIPLPQHLAEQLVHPGPSLRPPSSHFGTDAAQFRIPYLRINTSLTWCFLLDLGDYVESMCSCLQWHSKKTRNTFEYDINLKFRHYFRHYVMEATIKGRNSENWQWTLLIY